MWLLSLFLFILTVLTAVWARANAKWNPAVMGLTVLMLLSLSVQMLKQRGPQHIDYSTLWDKSIGYTLAGALTGDGIKQGTVLILDEKIPGANNPLAEIHFEGFQAGLPTNSELNLVKIHASELSTFDQALAGKLPEEMIPEGPVDLSYPKLKQSIKEHQNVVALVSFVGLPASMSNAQLAGLPPVYVYGLRQLTTDLPDETLLQISSIRAIVRRQTGGDSTAKPVHKNLSEIFSERFILKQPFR